MARISIVIPDEDKKAIEEIAARQDRNMSWIVRAAIQEYIEKNKEEEEN